MQVNQAKATDEVLNHVDRAHDAINEFRSDGKIVNGVLIRSRLESAPLKGACEELAKAIAIIDRTKRGVRRKK
jgi:hypothetical protein